MEDTQTNSIRTLALFGHGGSGKTTLAEALLHAANALPSKGSIEKGNTASDFDAQEKVLGHSLNSTLLHFFWRDKLIHLVDTPGYPDFIGSAIPPLAAVDTALIVIDAQAGIQFSTERLLRRARERKLCPMIVINKIDLDNLDLPGLVNDIRDRFGNECMIMDLPAHHAQDVIEILEATQGDSDFASVAQAHRALIDQIVEEDETLLARYLDDGQDPTLSELHAPFEKALRDGHLVPILFVSAKTGAGIPQLLHVLETLAPDPSESNPPSFFRQEANGKTTTFKTTPDTSKHVVAHVFKQVADPYLGKVSMFRMHQGTLRRDMQLYVGDSKRAFKVNHLYRVQGKDYLPVTQLLPGELGAIAKVDEIEFDAVLHDSHDEDHIHLQPLRFPASLYGLTVAPAKKGDEQRLFEVLRKLAMEDPSFSLEQHAEANEMVIRGLGEAHLQSKLTRLSEQYKLEVITAPPRIPYRETITQPAEGHCRHKKQSGGAGQFGEVFLRIEPLERGCGFEFADEVKGGTIPSTFMPAVEKGVRQALADGVLAGYPVEDLKVTVYDGKTHSVDGKEIAFFIAGRKATVEAIRAAAPAVLEPVVNIEIYAPDHSIGAITGDLSSRRGQVSGTAVRGAGQSTVMGLVPLAEIAEYHSRLKSMTGGVGSYTVEFSHYAPVPAQVQKELASQHQVKDED